MEFDTRLAYFTLYKVFGDRRQVEEVARKHNMEFDDLAQVAMIELWECKKRYVPGEATFKHYAIESIRYKLFAELRRRSALIRIPEEKRHEVRISYESLDKEVHSDTGKTAAFYIPSRQNVEKTVIRKMILEEKLNMLTSFQRSIIELQLEGKTNKEIALNLGSTTGSVNANASSALKKVNPERKRIRKLSGEFAALMDQGAEQEEIMKRLHLTPTQFRNYKYRYNKASS